MGPLVSTENAAKATGISVFELTRGYKEGRYPAIMIGKGGRGSKLRWDLDVLTNVIQQELLQNQQHLKAIV